MNDLFSTWKQNWTWLIISEMPKQLWWIRAWVFLAVEMSFPQHWLVCLVPQRKILWSWKMARGGEAHVCSFTRSFAFAHHSSVTSVCLLAPAIFMRKIMWFLIQCKKYDQSNTSLNTHLIPRFNGLISTMRQRCSRPAFASASSEPDVRPCF